MGQALYRQYRPKKLDDVVGQDHITSTLKNALKSGKISHAYLLTGPRGVGKTSVARILAHEVNDFAYDESAMQLDIIEIDAASNRRIDEIRDLRDKVHMAPTSGKYKVYIIDEVHMLTKEAFNALLKTLEEPPKHVIFILATTESHKLPETIISRTQRFSFKPIDKQQIVKHLKRVADLEKIIIDDLALELIAEHSDGSFRDSLSLLDQASSLDKKVNIDSVKNLLGIAPKDAIDGLVAAINNGQPKMLVDTLDRLEEQGYQSASLAKQLAENLRNQLIQNDNQIEASTILKLLKRLLDVPASTDPEKLLEVILLDVAFSNIGTSNFQPESTKAKSTEDIIGNINKKPDPEKVRDLAPLKSEYHEESEVVDNQINRSKESNDFSIEQWPAILDNIKTHHTTLYGILRMSQPTFDGEVLTLVFKFAFHQKRISEPKMQQLIINTFNTMGLKPVKISAIVQVSSPITTEAKVNNSVDVTTISNIFGDAEVLES